MFLLLSNYINKQNFYLYLFSVITTTVITYYPLVFSITLNVLIMLHCYIIMKAGKFIYPKFNSRVNPLAIGRFQLLFMKGTLYFRAII